MARTPRGGFSNNPTHDDAESQGFVSDSDDETLDSDDEMLILLLDEKLPWLMARLEALELEKIARLEVLELENKYLRRKRDAKPKTAIPVVVTTTSSKDKGKNKGITEDDAAVTNTKSQLEESVAKVTSKSEAASERSTTKTRQFQKAKATSTAIIDKLNSRIAAGEHTIGQMKSKPAIYENTVNGSQATIVKYTKGIQELEGSGILDNMDIATLRRHYEACRRKIEEVEEKALDEAWANMTVAEKKEVLGDR